MKRIITILLSVLFTVSIISCVENSGKYKDLKTRLDSLQREYGIRSDELDEVFAVLNEVEQGLQSIRESENIITVQARSRDGLDVPAESKERIRSDMKAIGEAIEKYKKQIDDLKRDNRIESAQFRKRLEALSAELQQKFDLIESLTRQLNEKDAQLAVKTEQIASLDLVVSNLKEEVETLNRNTDELKEKVASQDRKIYSVYYIVASKEELIAAGVLTKGGLFKSAKVSYQSEQNSFVTIDYREITSINTNAKRAKVLSVHPADSYSLEKINDEVILSISNPERFWEQTKYLVVQTN